MLGFCMIAVLYQSWTQLKLCKDGDLKLGKHINAFFYSLSFPKYAIKRQSAYKMADALGVLFYGALLENSKSLKKCKQNRKNTADICHQFL